MNNGMWYLGAMNDGLFIIDQPPQPAPVDYVCTIDHDVNVIVAMGTERERAEAIIKAHNDALEQNRIAALEKAAQFVETYHECPSTNDQNIAAGIRALSDETGYEIVSY